MPFKSIITSILLFGTLVTLAQKDKVLFTINGDKVYSSEFSRIYEKNLSLITNPSDKDVANYLDLYINYKLKLKEAYDLKMDTVPAYIREFTKYKNQLIQPYLKDENTKTDLVKEAFERLQKEVNASHILVQLAKNATPQDTLKAYDKINGIREKIVKGASFAQIAKEFSEDPSAKKNNGNLGYFSAFDMVYPFETVAYNTQIGKVSEIFKTRFGYHIIQVHDSRNSRGEVEIAHIMLKGLTVQNEAKINTILNELKQGAVFETLAKNYSQDGGSAKKGGLLPKFGSGRMVKSFEDVAFGLENEGDISKAIQTPYGWHILKLIHKYPVESFENLQDELKKKVEQGQRAKIIGNSVLNKILKEYNIRVDQTMLDAFSNPEWANNKLLQTNEPFLTIENKTIPVKEYYKFVSAQKNAVSNQVYERFKGQEVLAYYKAELPKKFPELGYTLAEYRDGLLLFDLMQKKIWEQAEKDTLGLQKYFSANRVNYQWGDRAEVRVLNCSTHEIAERGKALLLENRATDVIEATLSKLGLVSIKEGLFEKSSTVFPANFSFEKGISNIYTDDNQWIVIQVKNLLDAQPKELQEARGSVISNYQEYLEKNWIAKLKNKYPVKIKKSSLKALNIKYQ